VNAHATGTPAGDVVEARAIAAALGADAARRAAPLAVSSSKGAMGHLLGAAGAIEGAITALALARGRIPGTRNLSQPDAALPPPESGLVFPGHGAGALPAPGLRAAMSNSFGFGGTNASLLFTV
jgi:3-oxoacyl-[acyl-carrier-protein] synthase II